MTMQQRSLSPNSSAVYNLTGHDIAKLIISGPADTTFEIFNYNDESSTTTLVIHERTKTFEWEFNKKECKKIKVYSGTDKTTYTTIYYYD